ncbi:sugar-binding domain-containing protein [Isoptericola cucumis]|uniref:glycoside hydrolase family 2 protein n=1 Tax=Isoptericola cucumis TaxID=1776856 RepID=UPI0032092695
MSAATTAPIVLTTPWTDAVDADAPLPEYPRPQLVRPGWCSLNGPWQYAVTPLAAAADPCAVADPLDAPDRWDGRIVVPFSPETPLSGVGRSLRPDETLWYRRRFTLPRPLAPGERVLLHLGAVDQSCRVAVDGVEAGGHTGGYLPFSLDVTAALRAGDGSGEHEVTVAVRDVTDTSWLARGKQSSRRGGIWYTPQSGIWQTVWLEILPRVAVDRLRLVPDLDAGEVEVTVTAAHADDRATADVTVRAAGQVVAAAPVPVGAPTRLALDGPPRPWSPEDPFLYDVEVALGDDRVTSYVALRSFGVGRDAAGHPRLLLNGEPYLPVGLLDQGYWPDGGYTAPTDEALAADVRLARAMGFTMLRKHVKVEPLRWYHHCDRLGMLVWQDAVNGGGRYHPLVITAPVLGAPPLDDRRHRRFGREDAAGRERFEAELRELVEHLRDVPSVALWVPFNEAWGQFDSARVADLVRRLDPTRPVDHASGWHDQGAGDLRSLHVYFRPVRVPRRWRRGGDGRVLAVTEYGGYSLVEPGHTWGRKVFGYRLYRSRRTLARAVARLHDREIVPAVRRGLAATVYTQLSDVEDEVNGLVTYDRRVVKVPEHVMRQINDRLRAAAAPAPAPERTP